MNARTRQPKYAGRSQDTTPRSIRLLACWEDYRCGGMHKELVETGKMTPREFHDRIMHENSMPVEILRAIMTKKPLEKDFTSSWRFYQLGC